MHPFLSCQTNQLARRSHARVCSPQLGILVHLSPNVDQTCAEKRLTGDGHARGFEQLEVRQEGFGRLDDRGEGHETRRRTVGRWREVVQHQREQEEPRMSNEVHASKQL